MKPFWWMGGASVASWLLVAAIPGFADDREVLFGMLAPLAGAAATWVLVARTFGSHPEWLTSLMVAAFAAKLVFFGVYVTVMLTVLSLRPVPFVVSFTAYFITLHLVEALCLQRFFAERFGSDLRNPAYVRSVGAAEQVWERRTRREP
jgi:hypothetical protein